MRFLVTAGSTREKIDQVRDWGNIFTGNTGLRIARALVELGDVDLVTSNRRHIVEVADDSRITEAFFTTHNGLRSRLTELMGRNTYDAVFMTAAVSDYRPAGAFEVIDRETTEDGERWTVRDIQAKKIKSAHEKIAFLGQRTEKLVDLFRTAWNHRGILVKFKLEVDVSPEELIRIGQESRRASGAEYLVANALRMLDGPDAGAFLLSDAGDEWVRRDELAARLARLVYDRKT